MTINDLVEHWKCLLEASPEDVYNNYQIIGPEDQEIEFRDNQKANYAMLKVEEKNWSKPGFPKKDWCGLLIGGEMVMLDGEANGAMWERGYKAVCESIMFEGHKNPVQALLAPLAYAKYLNKPGPSGKPEEN